MRLHRPRRPSQSPKRPGWPSDSPSPCTKSGYLERSRRSNVPSWSKTTIRLSVPSTTYRLHSASTAIPSGFLSAPGSSSPISQNSPLGTSNTIMDRRTVSLTYIFPWQASTSKGFENPVDCLPSPVKTRRQRVSLSSPTTGPRPSSIQSGPSGLKYGGIQ